jgi:hypothetical protein
MTPHTVARPTPLSPSPLRRIAAAIGAAVRRAARRRRLAHEAALFAELSDRTLDDIGAPDWARQRRQARRDHDALRLLEQRW